jgi:hypothetical protein
MLAQSMTESEIAGELNVDQSTIIAEMSRLSRNCHSNLFLI